MAHFERQPAESGEHRPGEVSELGTGEAEEDDGNEPQDDPAPGIVGGGDQGAHPGSLGGEQAPPEHGDGASAGC
jgi:hypothetical protein